MKEFWTRDYISDWFNFDQRGLFKSEKAVRDYFTVANMRLMFEDHPSVSDFLLGHELDELEEMADTVIRNKWHCDF